GGAGGPAARSAGRLARRGRGSARPRAAGATRFHLGARPAHTDHHPLPGRLLAARRAGARLAPGGTGPGSRGTRPARRADAVAGLRARAAAAGGALPATGPGRAPMTAGGSAGDRLFADPDLRRGALKWIVHDVPSLTRRVSVAVALTR